MSVQRTHSIMAFQEVDTSAQLLTWVVPKLEPVTPSYTLGTFKNPGLKTSKKVQFLE